VNPVETLVTAVTSDDVVAAGECLKRHPELRARLDDPLPGLSFDSTVLLTAVWRRNIPMIELLLANGANINQRSHWWAGGFGVLDDDHGLAEFLIERGAQVDICAASRLGRLDTIRALLAEDPSRVHARGGDGQTPLHVAANAEVASLLVDAGADINARDIDHESTPAQYAIRERQNVARYLVARGCETDLLMACALADLDLVRKHLDIAPQSIAMTVSPDDFPMSNPRAGGSIYIWTLGANKSAHAIAREFGHEHVFRMLMERSPHELAVAAACEVGDEGLVRSLLNIRAIDPTQLNPRLVRKLADAAERNDAPAVRLLLLAGWPVDAVGTHGATALHFGAWHGNAELVRETVAHGSPFEARDRDFSMTPLGWAFHGSLHGWNRDRGDYAATVRALLTAGAVVPGAADSVAASDAVRNVLRDWQNHRGGEVLPRAR
jgi:ankyrin repeat protein